MLWVVMGAGGAGYGLVCTMVGCTTNQCISNEFWLPMYNGEPWVIALVANLAETAWPLLAVIVLVAGSVRLRGWRRRNWLRAAGWTGAWVAGFALMGLIVVAGWSWGNGSGAPDAAWGELPICGAWLALGAVIDRILSTPAHGRDVLESHGRGYR